MLSFQLQSHCFLMLKLKLQDYDYVQSFSDNVYITYVTGDERVYISIAQTSRRLAPNSQ